MSEQKPIKFADLARHWGISRPMVRKLVTEKELPCSPDGKRPAFASLTEADAWRAEHAPAKPPRASEKIGTEVGEKNGDSPDTTSDGNRDKDDFALSEDDTNDPPAAESRAAAREALAFAGKRARAPIGTLPLIDVEQFIRTDRDFDSLMIEQAERVPQIAFGLLTLKQKTGVSTAIANATDVWQQSAKAAASVRKHYLDLQERTRALIQLDQVMDIVGTELQALRSHLDKLGDKLGAAANPADPALATSVINDAIDKIYERMEAVQEVVRKEFSP